MPARPSLPADWREVLIALAAVETGLLAAFAEAREPAGAARAAGLDPRAVRIVATALADLGYLEDGGDGALTLSPRGAALLRPGDDGADVAAGLHLEARAMRSHLALADALRSGRPVHDVSAGDRATLERFARAMRHIAAPRVAATVAALGPGEGRRLLDAGGAPGSYARAFAAAGWEVTVLDLPDPLAAAGDDLRAAGVRAVAGDATRGLPEGPWEAVYLGNLLHLLEPEAAGALVERGRGGAGRRRPAGGAGGAGRREPAGPRLRRDDAGLDARGRGVPGGGLPALDGRRGLPRRARRRPRGGLAPPAAGAAAVRLWGEDEALVARAGGRVDALRRLEDALAADVAGVAGRDGAVDAHVHLGRDADGHRLDAAGLLADLDRWGIARAVCFAPNDPGPDGQFAAANDGRARRGRPGRRPDRALLPRRPLRRRRGGGDGAGRRRRRARPEAAPGGAALPPRGRARGRGRARRGRARVAGDDPRRLRRPAARRPARGAARRRPRRPR